MVEPTGVDGVPPVGAQPTTTSTVDETVVEALVLRSLPGVGPIRFRHLVGRFGSPGAALRAPDQDFMVLAGGAAADARSGQRLWSRARELRDRCEGSAIRIVPLGCPSYPVGLEDLPDPPPVLFVRGRFEALCGALVAMVGSRRASTYGRRTARILATTMVRRGYTVVSGMALGIDAASHEGALDTPPTGEGETKTIAVLGSGVDVPSPAQHHALYERIRENGALVSELDPGTAPAPHHFPRRNRIIAALARRVIVVEAAARSGALITAHVALDLGRDVYAVPGPLDRPSAAGSNRLVADGAGVVLDPNQPPWDERLAEPQVAASRSGSPEMGGLLAALDGEPRTVEDLASRANQPLTDVSIALVRLELRGEVRRTHDGCYAASVGRGPATG